MRLVRLEDSYQMCTRAEFYENLIRVAATPKKQVLTDVVLETLAIIAYKQPVTKADIEKIRGVKSDHAVNRLIEYNLVYEAGRLDAPGRPALFATTEEFLRRFGVGSTNDLPEMDLEQREEIKAEVEEELNLKLDEDGRPVDEAAASMEDEVPEETGTPEEPNALGSGKTDVRSQKTEDEDLTDGDTEDKDAKDGDPADKDIEDKGLENEDTVYRDPEDKNAEDKGLENEETVYRDPVDKDPETREAEDKDRKNRNTEDNNSEDSRQSDDRQPKGQEENIHEMQ